MLPSSLRCASCFLALAASSLLSAQQVRKHELAAPVPDPVSLEIGVQSGELVIKAKETNKAAYWFVGGIFGLMAASSVDKDRNRQAGELTSELRDLLNTFDFRASLVQRFEGGVNPAVVPVLGEVRFLSRKPGETAELPVDLMSIQYGYTLTDDFRSLQVTMACALWNAGAPSTLENRAEDQIRRQARYYQTFTYELTPETIAGVKEPRQRAGQWLDQGKEQLGAWILSGMNTLEDALSYDLASPGMEAGLRTSAGVGHLIQETGTQQWIRAETGEITILEVN